MASETYIGLIASIVVIGLVIIIYCYSYHYLKHIAMITHVMYLVTLDVSLILFMIGMPLYNKTVSTIGE